MLWCSPCLLEVQSCLVFYANSDGTITNSDLELAASRGHHDIIVSHVDAREATIHNFSDDMVAVYWQRKGVVSNSEPVARLLRLQDLHQR
jgi:hypothetical protein